MNSTQSRPARSPKADEAPFLDSINALLIRVIGAAGAPPDILQQTLDAGMAAVGGHRGFLAIVNHETGELQITCTSGEGWTDETRRMRLQLSRETHRGITGHVALTCQPYITGNV